MVNHQIIRASAGTGKTYNLVDRYVRLLDQGLLPRQIVVITFTRKAARELRGRISRQLSQLQYPHRIQSQLPFAPISNFHGMCLRWLAQFSTDSRHADPSNLLANQSDALLFQQACHDAWAFCQSHVEGDWTTLAQYINIERDFPQAAWSALSMAREGGFDPEQMRWPTWDEQLERQQVHRSLVAVHEQIMGATPLRGKGEENRQKLLKLSVGQLEDDFTPWHSHWLLWLESIKLQTSIKQLISKQQRDELKSQLLALEASTVVRPLEPLVQQLVTLAWQGYKEAKQQQGALDFVDIIAETVRLLAQNEQAHHAIRQQVGAVLVDEAQDTNGLQRRLVHLIAGLEGPAATKSAKATLIVVGDWKQCIYTFRGANPASFAAFGHDIEQLRGESHQLTISRRSSPQIVAGINHLGRALFDHAYEPLEPWFGESSTDAAPMSIDANTPRPAWCWLDTSAMAAPDQRHTPQIEGEAIASWLVQAFEHGANPQEYVVLMPTMTHGPTLGQILQDHGIPYVLAGGGGLLAQSEIQDMLALLHWLLQPGEALSAAIALRSPLFGCSDDQLLWLSQSDGKEVGWEKLANGAFSQQMCQQQRSSGADLWQIQQWLCQWRQKLWLMDVAELMAHIWHTCDAWAVYARLPGGLQAKANGDGFCQLARLDHQRYQDGLIGFLRRMQQRGALGLDEPLPPIPMGSQGAVLLSSVHQSKGLEYKHVILAGLTQGGRSDGDVLRSCADGTWVFQPRQGKKVWSTQAFLEAKKQAAQAQQDERKRLLYVAMTRAKSSLILVGPRAKLSSKGWGAWLDPWHEEAVAAGVMEVIPAQPARRRELKLQERWTWQPFQLPALPPARWSYEHSQLADAFSLQEGYDLEHLPWFFSWRQHHRDVLRWLFKGREPGGEEQKAQERFWRHMGSRFALAPEEVQSWQQAWSTWQSTEQPWFGKSSVPSQQRISWQRVVQVDWAEQQMAWDLQLDGLSWSHQALTLLMVTPHPLPQGRGRSLYWQLALAAYAFRQFMPETQVLQLACQCWEKPDWGWTKIWSQQDHLYAQRQIALWLEEGRHWCRDWLSRSYSHLSG